MSIAAGVICVVGVSCTVMCWLALRAAAAHDRDAALRVLDAVEHRRQAERKLRYARAIAEEHACQAALDDGLREP